MAKADRTIKKVAILGASGNMGSLSGGLFAQAGIECVFFARSLDKANAGIEAAVAQARSDVLRKYIRPATYEELEKEIPTCDWVFEGLAEDLAIKNEFFSRIEKVKKPEAIVSTVSSGLSIRKMAEGRSDDFRKNFLGTHFYNPPGKLPANELIFHPDMPKSTREFIYNFCANVLRRVNIITEDTPAFAGNRIGFQFLNDAAIHAEKYGADTIDYLLGPYTGRALPPLATIDLVGLDVHKAIVDNVYHNVRDERIETYKMPDYMQRMIDSGMLGRKAKDKGGFFHRDAEKNKLTLDIASLSHVPAKTIKIDWVEKAKQAIHDGFYSRAVDILRTASGEEANLVRYFLLGYVAYSFARVGEVTPAEDGIHGIDRVMAYGFSWLPPSGWVDLLGGVSAACALIEKAGLPVPTQLKNLKAKGRICRVPDITKFLVGR